MDQTIVVTGAVPGIGKAVMERLLRKRMAVFAIARHIDTLREEVSDTARSRICFLQADITDEAAVRACLESASDGIPILGGLVNAAGFGGYGETLESDAGAWRNVVGVCLTGTYVTTKVVGGAMRRQGTRGASIHIARPRTRSGRRAQRTPAGDGRGRHWYQPGASIFPPGRLRATSPLLTRTPIAAPARRRWAPPPR